MHAVKRDSYYIFHPLLAHGPLTVSQNSPLTLSGKTVRNLWHRCHKSQLCNHGAKAGDIQGEGNICLTSTPVWPSGKTLDWQAEGPRLDTDSALFSLQKGCGLWTLSCDFVPHS